MGSSSWMFMRTTQFSSVWPLHVAWTSSSMTVGFSKGVFYKGKVGTLNLLNYLCKLQEVTPAPLYWWKWINRASPDSIRGSIICVNTRRSHSLGDIFVPQIPSSWALNYDLLSHLSLVFYSQIFITYSPRCSV